MTDFRYILLWLDGSLFLGFDEDGLNFDNYIISNQLNSKICGSDPVTLGMRSRSLMHCLLLALLENN